MKKQNVIGIVLLVIFSLIVTAYQFGTIYNPFTGKLDYHVTENFSGYNITADYYFGNGSQLTSLPSADGWWALSDTGWIVNSSNSLDWNETKGNNTYIQDSDEGNLNVNSSNYWDGLNAQTDITDVGTLADLTVSGAVNLNLNWTYLQNYPSACPSSSAVTQLGDTVTCTDSWVDAGGDVMTGDLNMSNNNVTDVNCIVFQSGGKICNG